MEDEENQFDVWRVSNGKLKVVKKYCIGQKSWEHGAEKLKATVTRVEGLEAMKGDKPMDETSTMIKFAVNWTRNWT